MIGPRKNLIHEHQGKQSFEKQYKGKVSGNVPHFCERPVGFAPMNPLARLAFSYILRHNTGNAIPGFLSVKRGFGPLLIIHLVSRYARIYVVNIQLQEGGEDTQVMINSPAQDNVGKSPLGNGVESHWPQ